MKLTSLFLSLSIIAFTFGFAQHHQQAQGFTSFEVFSTSEDSQEASLQDIARDIQFLNVDSQVLQDIQNEKPTFLSFELIHHSDTIQVKLQRHELFTEDFIVRNQDDELLNYSPGLYYRGEINNQRNTFAVFNFFEGSVNGIVSEPNKGNRVIGQLKNSNQYVVYSDANMNVSSTFVCTADEVEQLSEILPQNPLDIESDLTTNCVKKFYELTFDIYQANFSDVTITMDWLTSVHNVVATLYTDAGIQIALSDVLIWQEEDPYVGENLDKLIFFRENRIAFNGDLAHLLDLPVTGGVAYLDSLCTSFRHGFSGLELFYEELPTYSWTILVIAHEMGHSLGSPHTHACFWNGDNTAIDSCGSDAGFSEGCDDGPTPFIGGTVMSYCHLTSVGINLALGFHPQVAAHMANTVDAKSCLGTDCIDSCMRTVAGITVDQTEDTTLTIMIEDVISDSWDYTVYEFQSYPDFTTISENFFTYNPILPNNYYSVRVANNCSNGDYGSFIIQNYLSDADWCSGITFTEPWFNQFNLNKNFTKTFYPNSDNEKVSFTINEFSLNDGEDFMTIYDGESTNAPIFMNGDSLTGADLETTYFEATNDAGAITVAYTSSNAANNSSWDITLSCETFSVNRFTNNEVTISPNPFENQLQIQSDLTLDHLVVFDINGRKVLQQNLHQQNNLNLDFAQLTPGMYFIQLKSGSNTTVQRIIKK